jgi:hypothetical protein
MLVLMPCIGFPAGITATLVCFPLDVLRTRLMAPWGHKYGGPLRTLQGMAKFEGLGALYAGTQLQTVISFVVHYPCGCEERDKLLCL